VVKAMGSRRAQGKEKKRSLTSGTQGGLRRKGPGRAAKGELLEDQAEGGNCNPHIGKG